MGLFSSKTETESKVKPYDKTQFKDILNRLEYLGQTPQQFFPEQTYAGLAPQQEEALGMREEYARGMAGMVDPAMQAWQSAIAAPDVANNPYVQGMLEQQRSQVMRGLSEAMPSIQSGMLGVNERLGGTGQGVAAGIAGRGALEALANQAAQTQMDAYTAGLGQQRFGLGSAPAMAQFGMAPSDVLMGVGDIRRAEEQRAIDEERARFEFGQEEPWRRLERQAGIFQPMTLPYAKKKTTSKDQPSGLQIGGQLAGLGLSAAGMFGGLPSFGGGASPSGGGLPMSYGGMSSMSMPYQFLDPASFGFRGAYG